MEDVELTLFSCSTLLTDDTQHCQ